MPSRSRDRVLYDRLSEMNRSSGRTFVGLMRPAQSTQHVPIAVGV